MMVKRVSCGASQCIHNHNFTCKLEQIEVDDTTKCISFEEE